MEQIIELVLTNTPEAYMGRYEQLKKFPEEFHTETDPLKYLEGDEEFCG